MPSITELVCELAPTHVIVNVDENTPGGHRRGSLRWPSGVKLDENLGRSPVALLRDAGYTVDRVHDQGLSGAADEVVWQRVCTEDRFFVTLDLDFSDVRRFPPGSHAGILLLRPRSRGRRGCGGEKLH